MSRWWMVGVLVVGFGCASEVPPEMVLATYQGGEVTEVEYRSWLAATKAEHDAARVKDVVTTVALHESLAEAARQRGVDRQTAEALALADIEHQALERALRRHVSDSIEVDDDTIADWLARHGARLDRPRRVRLSNIFKRTEGADRTRLRAEMESIQQELLDGADWAATALQESDSQTRFRRGSIGLVKPGTLDARIEAVAFALEPGEISSVVETEDGLTLLRCDGVEAATRPTEDEKRARAAAKVREKAWAEAWRAREAELLAPVQLDVAAAQRVSTGLDAVIAEVEGGWRMTLADVEVLLPRRGVRRRLPDLPEARATQLLEALAMGRQAAEKARTLGLDQEADLMADVQWRRTLMLGANELSHRVQNRFVPLGEDEIRAYFDQDPDQFQVTETFRLAAISWRAEEGKLRERYRFGEQLVADLRQGTIDFEAAAEQYSERPSASNGGRLGWLDQQQAAALGPHVYQALLALEPGQTSPLVQQPDALPSTGSALWILHLLDRRPARALRFEEARHQAENALGNERTRVLQGQIEQELVSGLGLEMAEVEDIDQQP